MSPSKYDTEDHVEGLECPHCGEVWDTLMDRPALKRSGWNPRSGRLYDCGCCRDRVTEIEMETGKSMSELLDSGEIDEFTPERRREE